MVTVVMKLKDGHVRTRALPGLAPRFGSPAADDSARLAEPSARGEARPYKKKKINKIK